MQHTIQHLFQVKSLEEVSRERLEELVTNYPSFSVGRYLLSRKLHAEQDGHFSEETQKTNLYFSNPFWLQWLLQNEEPVSARAALPDYGTPTVVEAPMTDGEEGNGVEPASGDIFFQERLTVNEEAAPREPGPQTSGPVQAEAWADPETIEPALKGKQETVREELTETEDTIDPRVKELLEAVRGEHKETGKTQTTVDEAPEAVPGEFGQNTGAAQAEAREYSETVPGETRENPAGAEGVAKETAVSGSGTADGVAAVTGTTPEERAAAGASPDREGKTSISLRSIQVEEPGVEAELKAANVSSAPLTAAEALLQHLAEARGLRQALVKMNEGETSAEGIAQPGSTEETSGLSGGENADTGETGTPETIKTVGAGREEQLQAATVDNETQAGGQVPTQQPPSAIVAHAMALAEPVVEFEPYHTIDYFASVGIKFVQEENPSDKLGKQLKSFTDWLKVMRRLPQKNQEIVPDMAVEHQIQAIAAHSIKGKEVVTETMAEVLVKQGMREKAVDVYHKLSLLNPDKSAYFAAKIEQLKID